MYEFLEKLSPEGRKYYNEIVRVASFDVMFWRESDDFATRYALDGGQISEDSRRDSRRA